MFGRLKKYTITDEQTGREITQAGPVDARLWKRAGQKNGRPVRAERTNLCSACGLHNCGGGPCGEKGSH